MSKTNIGWVRNPDGTRGEVWNPTVGCSHSGSRGCDFCYAERMAMRLKAMGRTEYQDVVDDKGWTGDVLLCWNRIDQPPRWRKPRRVFVDSMSDLFHERVPDEYITQVFQTIAGCSQHTFIILTKRYSRAQGFLRNATWLHLGSNAWLIFSASTQEEVDHCVPILLRSDAAVRGLSLEPMLSPVDLTAYLHCGLSWCIIGCESGPRHRPMDEDWARKVITQCKSAEIAVFYKQKMEGNRRILEPELDGHRYAEFPQTIVKPNGS